MEAIREGLNAALTAVRLDEQNPYSHYALAICSAYANAPEQAMLAAERAVEISPSFALGHLILGMGLLFRGSAVEAIAPLEHGLRLNPHDPQNFVWLNFLALAYQFAGQAEEAIASGVKALEHLLLGGPSTKRLSAVVFLSAGCRKPGRMSSRCVVWRTQVMLWDRSDSATRTGPRNFSEFVEESRVSTSRDFLVRRRNPRRCRRLHLAAGQNINSAGGYLRSLTEKGGHICAQICRGKLVLIKLIGGFRTSVQALLGSDVIAFVAGVVEAQREQIEEW